MQKTQKIQPVVKIIPHYLIILLIAAVGMAVYYRSIIKGIFFFDDEGLILNNYLIKNFSYIKDIFRTQLYHGSGVYSNFYRPMQSLSLMLDYHLWVLKPFGYHMTNVFIHILNAVCVYFLVYLLSKKQYVSIFTGMIFCVHTVLSWPVNYVASRSDLLIALFFLTSFISYVLYREGYFKGYGFFLYAGSLFAFILAILSKEVACILPFVILLYLFCFSKREKDAKKYRPSLAWVFFIITAVYAYLRFTVLNFTQGKLLETTTGMLPMYIRFLTTSKVMMIYLRLLVAPVGLHMEWDIDPATSFLQDEVFLSVTVLLVIAGFMWYLFRASRLKFFAIAWFFITILPYSNIFPLNYFMGEGWLYVPSIGFFTLAGLYLYELKNRSRSWSIAVISAIGFLIIFYGILTVKRADVWADPIRLYTEVLKYSPTNTKARINMGVLLTKSGSYDEAEKRYKEAAKFLPNNAGLHSNLANVYIKKADGYANKKMYGLALKEFEKAVELNPKDYVAYNNIGILYKQQGQIKKAMEKYAKALEINPAYPLTYNNIGNIYLESGQYDTAIRFYKKAIKIDPNNAAFYGNLGKVYKNKGMIKEARESFEKALKLNPGHKDAMEGLDGIK
ncbi:MAG: tetratricopeptide repeat protein [Candidatus Omnitrophica bacterium]|nr:tetratricopeptide repeat protein [Candidatus Omnitrophota bacterium]